MLAQPAVQLHERPEHSCLMVFFGGISGGIAVPRFEFARTSSDVPASRLYLRDLEQAWYHRGLRGLTRGIDDTAEYLCRVRERVGATRTVVMGNSMGGYAAILFACLTKADLAIAYSPQTFIDRENRLRVGDHRWSEQIDALLRSDGPPSPYLDLRTVLALDPERPVHVHYSTADELDAAHALHIASLPGVTLTAYEHEGHDLVRYLRDTGALREIVARAAEGQSAPGGRAGALPPSRHADSSRKLDVMTCGSRPAVAVPADPDACPMTRLDGHPVVARRDCSHFSSDA